ncbi:MAG TPA: c-type cytochrome [Thermoanaerobaculia bacterium]|jgi:mono/diheme cytochrome c family protein
MARRVILVAIAIVAALAIAAVLSLRGGMSARDEPSRAERLVARAARHWAVPRALRNAKNPIPVTPPLLAEARAHFADHCAGCHGNDGKGSPLGISMYPKAPDMTLAATQSLSDGELFAIIENGVRLTGMPAFGNGTAASARGSWLLVHFIRHLPRLSAAEREEMESLNPKTPEEWRAQQEESDFLSGHTH